jgi:hypothetical protein
MIRAWRVQAQILTRIDAIRRGDIVPRSDIAKIQAMPERNGI